ncbi:hypothetical protein BU230_16100 [Klebsiella pneumoniae]|nr:hypothetical protein BU230_16100 [Klebsiella pneumoniae]
MNHPTAVLSDTSPFPLSSDGYNLLSTSTVHCSRSVADSQQHGLKWFTEFGHLNRGDMLTSEQHRCHNEKKKFQRRV